MIPISSVRLGAPVLSPGNLVPHASGQAPSEAQGHRTNPAEVESGNDAKPQRKAFDAEAADRAQAEADAETVARWEAGMDKKSLARIRASLKGYVSRSVASAEDLADAEKYLKLHQDALKPETVEKFRLKYGDKFAEAYAAGEEELLYKSQKLVDFLRTAVAGESAEKSGSTPPGSHVNTTA